MSRPPIGNYSLDLLGALAPLDARSDLLSGAQIETMPGLDPLA